MIHLRWRNTILRFIAREFVTAIRLFAHLRRRAHAKRVNPAARLHADFRVHADDLRDERPLEFRAESALRSRRIPQPEYQRGGAQFVEWRSIL